MNALSRYRGGRSDAHSLVLVCVDTHANPALHFFNHILSEGENQMLHSRCCCFACERFLEIYV